MLADTWQRKLEEGSSHDNSLAAEHKRSANKIAKHVHVDATNGPSMLVCTFDMLLGECAVYVLLLPSNVYDKERCKEVAVYKLRAPCVGSQESVQSLPWCCLPQGIIAPALVIILPLQGGKAVCLATNDA